jgi:hypothetical protein
MFRYCFGIGQHLVVAMVAEDPEVSEQIASLLELAEVSDEAGTGE